MKQMTIYPENTIITTPYRYALFIDGAAKNNPGPAGVGIFLTKNDQPIIQRGFFVGSKTNNQAEYLALIVGVYLSKKTISKEDTLHIFSDSQLLARQMVGEYKIKNGGLKPLFLMAKQELAGLHYTIAHIPREENVMADMLANQGIEKKIHVPKDFLELLDQYGITL